MKDFPSPLRLQGHGASTGRSSATFSAIKLIGVSTSRTKKRKVLKTSQAFVSFLHSKDLGLEVMSKAGHLLSHFKHAHRTLPTELALSIFQHNSLSALSRVLDLTHKTIYTLWEHNF